MNSAFQVSVPLARGATLSDQVAGVLRERISDGIWGVGVMLPSESILAQELAVSRTVIREAVAGLRAEGLLDSQQGRGMFVASDRPRMGFAIDKHDVESLRKLAHILELRMGIEIEAAAVAAARSGAREHAEIQAAANAYERAKGNVEDGVSNDLRFHRAICEATGNDYFLGLFNYLGASLRETMLAGRLLAVERGSESHDAAGEHHAVAAAIVQGDPDRARDHMRAHLDRSSARLLGQLQPAEPAP